MCTSDHEKIGPALASHHLAWTARAAEHDEAAERGRDEKRRVMGKQTGIPDEPRLKLQMAHDAAIGHHEKQARIHRRRAALAGAGYLHHGPDEIGDAMYMKEHADLIGLAQRTGRLRQSDERLDDV